MRKNQTNVLALLALAFGLLFILPFASATTTLVSPVAGTNQSTTMVVNVTTDLTEPLNATIWYNASGGATGTLLTTILNDTDGDTEFYSASVDISSLADATTYNFTAIVNNGTDTEETAGALLTIDNTAPSTSITLGRSSINVGNTNDFSWTSSDATSGLETVSLTVTAPGSCSISSSTDSAGSMTVTGSQQTGCSGTYTITLTATDYAGNSDTSTQTFKATEAGKKDGSNTLGGNQGEPTKTQNLIWVALGIIVIYFVFFKKK